MYSNRASLTKVKKINYGSKSSQTSQRYTVICLTIIGVFLVGTGAALIFVGDSHEIQDLLILGPFFLVAGVGFTIMMIVIIARPIFEEKIMKLKKDKKKNRKTQLKSKRNLGTIEESVPYITDYKRDVANIDDVHQIKSPSRVQIYGSNKFHVAIINNKVSDINQPGVVDTVSEGYVSDENVNPVSKDQMLKSNPSLYSTLYASAKSNSLSRNPTPPPDASVASGSDSRHSINTPSGDSKIPDVPTYSYGPAVTPLPNEVESSSL